MPWEAPGPFFPLLPGPRPTLSDKRAPRITLPQSISLPLEEKRAAISPSSLPPQALIPPHLLTRPLRPSALHLSRGSLQSQDNLETSAGSLPETLKKFPPSLLFSLSILTSPVHPPTSPPLQPSSWSLGHYSIFSSPRPLFSLLRFIF